MKAPFSLALVVYLGVVEGLLNCDFSAPNPNLALAHQVNAKVIYDPEHLPSHEYDYVIVGGGLTGLTVAAQLTENANITVLVIESGFWESDRSADVSNLTHYGCVFGTAMDHRFATTNQTSDDRSQVIRSGRGLGGSTLINGGSWSKQSRSLHTSLSSISLADLRDSSPCKSPDRCLGNDFWKQGLELGQVVTVHEES